MIYTEYAIALTEPIERTEPTLEDLQKADIYFVKALISGQINPADAAEILFHKVYNLLKIFWLLDNEQALQDALSQAQSDCTIVNGLNRQDADFTDTLLDIKTILQAQDTLCRVLAGNNPVLLDLARLNLMKAVIKIVIECPNLTSAGDNIRIQDDIREILEEFELPYEDIETLAENFRREFIKARKAIEGQSNGVDHACEGATEEEVRAELELWQELRPGEWPDIQGEDIVSFGRRLYEIATQEKIGQSGKVIHYQRAPPGFKYRACWMYNANPGKDSLTIYLRYDAKDSDVLHELLACLKTTSHEINEVICKMDFNDEESLLSAPKIISAQRRTEPVDFAAGYTDLPLLWMCVYSKGDDLVATAWWAVKEYLENARFRNYVFKVQEMDPRDLGDNTNEVTISFDTGDNVHRVERQERGVRLKIFIRYRNPEFEALFYKDSGPDLGKMAGYVSGKIRGKYSYFWQVEFILSRCREKREKEEGSKCTAAAPLPLPVSLEGAIRSLTPKNPKKHKKEKLDFGVETGLGKAQKVGGLQTGQDDTDVESWKGKYPALDRGTIKGLIREAQRGGKKVEWLIKAELKRMGLISLFLIVSAFSSGDYTFSLLFLPLLGMCAGEKDSFALSSAGRILQICRGQFLLEYRRLGYFRPGSFGYTLGAISERLNSWFGPGGWKVMHRLQDGSLITESEAIQLYEDAYYVYLQSNPEILEELLAIASDVYDTAPSNIHSGFDYTIQETASRHLQDIAIRRVVRRLDKKFRGTQLIQVRGRHSPGWHLNPGVIPFHKRELVLHPKLTGWWRGGSVEEFFQNTKVIILNEQAFSEQGIIRLGDALDIPELAGSLYEKFLPFFERDTLTHDDIASLFWALRPHQVPRDKHGQPRKFTYRELEELFEALDCLFADKKYLPTEYRRKFVMLTDWHSSSTNDHAKFETYLDFLPLLFRVLEEEQAVPVFLARDALPAFEFGKYLELVRGRSFPQYLVYQPGSPTPYGMSHRKSARALDMAIWVTAEIFWDVFSMMRDGRLFSRERGVAESDEPDLYTELALRFASGFDLAIRHRDDFCAQSRLVYEQLRRQNISFARPLVVVDLNATGKTALYIRNVIDYFSNNNTCFTKEGILLGWAREKGMGIPELGRYVDNIPGEIFPDIYWPFMFLRQDADTQTPVFKIRKNIAGIYTLLCRSIMLYDAAVDYASEGSPRNKTTGFILPATLFCLGLGMIALLSLPWFINHGLAWFHWAGKQGMAIELLAIGAVVSYVTLTAMGMQKFVFSRKPFSNPKSDQGQISQSFVGSNLLERADLIAIQPQGNKLLAWLNKFYFSWFKFIHEFCNTMGIPKLAFFFQRLKFRYSFHRFLPPFKKPAFRFRHRTRGNYLGLILNQILKYYGKVSSAFRLSQRIISILSAFKNKWVHLKTNFFHFFRLNAVFGYMRYRIFVPGNVCYPQFSASNISIRRNTKDVKKIFALLFIFIALGWAWPHMACLPLALAGMCVGSIKSKIDPEAIQDYLRDESRINGRATKVWFPENELEVAAILAEANRLGIAITIQGGRTGLVAAAVPFGGWVISTEKMNKIIKLEKLADESYVVVQPGARLSEVQDRAEEAGLFYASNPTNRDSYIGGNVNTDASGSWAFKYGSTRRYVNRLRIVLANGNILDIRRGQVKLDKDGKIMGLNLQPLLDLLRDKMPNVKSSAGYFVHEGMDLIDLFIGSEGTLGVVTEIELKLFAQPPPVVTALIFYRSVDKALNFVKATKYASQNGLDIRAIELIDESAFEFIGDKLRGKYPQIPLEAKCAVLVEQEIPEGTDELSLAEVKGFPENEGSSWFTLPEDEKLKRAIRDLRHDIPTMVNEKLQREKMGTDLIVAPDIDPAEFLTRSKEILQRNKVTHAIWGHISENQLHINLLPQDDAEYERALNAYCELAGLVTELGGSVAAEHGIGKTKHPYLEIMYGPEIIQEMQKIKAALDPHWILGRGNIFPVLARMCAVGGFKKGALVNGLSFNQGVPPSLPMDRRRKEEEEEGETQ